MTGSSPLKPSAKRLSNKMSRQHRDKARRSWPRHGRLKKNSFPIQGGPLRPILVGGFNPKLDHFPR